MITILEDGSVKKRQKKHQWRASLPAKYKLDQSCRLAEILISVSGLYSRWAAEKITHQSLTLNKLRVLALLQEVGPQKMGKLGDALGILKANMTAIIDQLEDGGLVRRKLSPENRRVLIVELTDAGYEIISKDSPAYLKEVAKIFDGLSKQELKTFEGLLLKLFDKFFEQKVVDLSGN